MSEIQRSLISKLLDPSHLVISIEKMGHTETNPLRQTACKKFGNCLYFGDTDEITINQFR
jgi:hypothetical protein